jgi:GNAT superfamily N-acetyltransferase
MIRPATEADLPLLLALYAELHTDDTPPPPDVARETWRQIAGQSGRTILVAEFDGAVAGTVDCTVIPNLTRNARPFMLIENVVVAASVWRKGVGSALMDAALDLARATGCYKIQLLTNMRRDGAHVFYETNGFQPIAQGYRLYLK